MIRLVCGLLQESCGLTTSSLPLDSFRVDYDEWPNLVYDSGREPVVEALQFSYWWIWIQNHLLILSLHFKTD